MFITVYDLVIYLRLTLLIHSFIHSYIRLKTRLTYRNPTTA